MRRLGSAGATLCLVALAACDDKKPPLDALGDAAALTMTSGDSGSASPSPSASVVMPERPVPKPETMVSSSAPDEVQMKAIAYMVAMRAPHPDDAPADTPYATDLVNKLKPISLGIDNGPDKPHWNHTDIVANGRQIDMFMSQGCDAKTPFNAVVQRANIPLSTLLPHGVLVVRCNDTRKQCLQSTRDADDVLCTTAPRHK